MLIGDWNDGFDEVGFFPDGMWSTKPAPPPQPKLVLQRLSRAAFEPIESRKLL